MHPQHMYVCHNVRIATHDENVHALPTVCNVFIWGSVYICMHMWCWYAVCTVQFPKLAGSHSAVHLYMCIRQKHCTEHLGPQQDRVSESMCIPVDPHTDIVPVYLVLEARGRTQECVTHYGFWKCNIYISIFLLASHGS